MRITASAGVACTNGLDDGRDILGEADLALYEAKRGGRNRVFLPALAPRPELAVAC